MQQPILSHYQTKPILQAMGAGDTQVTTSLDLGMSLVHLSVNPSGLVLPDGSVVGKADLQKISAADVSCFWVGRGALKKIHAYSSEFERHYSLMPTEAAPTMLISGLPMHRIKDTNPHKDTQAKIRAAQPRGCVLDTATGLGYTAIQSAQASGVTEVTTIELDPAAQTMCAANPWSQALFGNPKIAQKIGDSFDVIETLDAEYFSCVLHDPPMFNLAGHLYSADFYRELWRVLKPNGRVFHYIGDPDSKSGSRTTRGVVERLRQVGFARVEPARAAFGVVAFKR